MYDCATTSQSVLVMLRANAVFERKRRSPLPPHFPTGNDNVLVEVAAHATANLPSTNPKPSPDTI